jgi:hypothetical protein
VLAWVERQSTATLTQFGDQCFAAIRHFYEIDEPADGEVAAALEEGVQFVGP